MPCSAGGSSQPRRSLLHSTVQPKSRVSSVEPADKSEAHASHAAADSWKAVSQSLACARSAAF